MGSAQSRKNKKISVWKLSDFEKISTVVGETSFPYSSWGDFVTYSTPNGANGHITLHSLAKNYLEIGMDETYPLKASSMRKHILFFIYSPLGP